MLLISALFKGLSELSDAQSRRVLWLSIGLTAFTMIVTIVGTQVGLQYFPLLGIEWVDTILQSVIGAGSIVIAWFLFPIVATAFIGVFLDRVCRIIEQRDYTADPAGVDMGTASALIEALSFLGFALFVNLCAFALALLLPPIYPFVYFAANGYIIAREYFFQAGLRHAPRPMVRELYHRHRMGMILMGMGLTLMLLVPVLNLCVPLIAVATMIHMFKGVAKAETVA